jgi:nicotinamidase-related amidase
MNPDHVRRTAAHGALLVIDIQEKLIRAIEGAEQLIASSLLLVKAARILEIPVFATEQYPRGLGPTVEPLASLIPERPSKLTFHCLGSPGLAAKLAVSGVRHLTLAGIETHVCVAQTAIELLGLGYQVQVAADAVGSRYAIDKEYALRRLEKAGATISTSEAILFEWTETAEHPRFKELSALVKGRSA